CGVKSRPHHLRFSPKRIGSEPACQRPAIPESPSRRVYRIRPSHNLSRFVVRHTRHMRPAACVIAAADGTGAVAGRTAVLLRHFFLVASTIALAIRSAFSRKSSISFQAFSWVMGRSNLQYSALAACACALQFNIDVTPTTLPFAGRRENARGPQVGGTA